MLYDVIVIGGGPAGYTCALYAARANLNVLVLEKLAPGGQMATTDRGDNYPGFPDGVEGFELAMSMKKGAERFGAVSQMADVTEVKLQGDIKEICAGGKQLQARTVVLASGARPRELGLPGEKELRGATTSSGRRWSLSPTRPPTFSGLWRRTPASPCGSCGWTAGPRPTTSSCSSRRTSWTGPFAGP